MTEVIFSIAVGLAWVAYVTVDRRLVRELVESAERAAISRAIFAIAHGKCPRCGVKYEDPPYCECAFGKRSIGGPYWVQVKSLDEIKCDEA